MYVTRHFRHFFPHGAPWRLAVLLQLQCCSAKAQRPRCAHSARFAVGVWLYREVQAQGSIGSTQHLPPRVFVFFSFFVPCFMRCAKLLRVLPVFVTAGWHLFATKPFIIGP
jgi:hypothetical protein